LPTSSRTLFARYRNSFATAWLHVECATSISQENPDELGTESRQACGEGRRATRIADQSGAPARAHGKAADAFEALAGIPLSDPEAEPEAEAIRDRWIAAIRDAGRHPTPMLTSSLEKRLG
jgi:hypothetical protein